MATGTQTGMRTGYSSAPTGARCSAPAVSNSPLQKIIKIINSMPPKQKMIAGVIIGFILVTVISFACISKASQYVALYDTKLTESDFKAIGDKLTQLGIDYKTEGSGTILISPAQKNSAKMQLAQYGLPRRVLSLSVPDNTFTPVTPAALEQKHIQQLEIEMTDSIRQIEGITDAFVKIAVPKTDYFAQDKKNATASILLKTQPGIRLTNTQVKGIASFVSSSVEGLKPENVQIIDNKGFNLSKQIVWNENDPSVISEQQLEKKVAYEKNLEQKVQEMLDSTMGIGKSKVVINASLDHSTKNKETYIVGGAENSSGETVTKRKVKTEKYSSDPSRSSESGAVPMSVSSIKGSGNSNYSKEELIEIKDANKVITKTQTPAGTLQRLTASVLVNNFKPDMTEKIENLVKNAIGIDETRGDSITVASMPFVNGEESLSAMYNTMITNRNKSARTDINSIAITPGIAIAVTIILMMVAAIYVLRQQNVNSDKTKLILSSASTADSYGIYDLASDKAVRSTLPSDTRVNTSQQLEILAKEKPTRVAELLRTTWLAS